jgi:hypothetical protein
MNILLIRISLGLQLFSLPLLTPQVVGAGMLDWVRSLITKFSEPTSAVARVVSNVAAVVFVLGVSAQAIFGHAHIFDAKSWPHWAVLAISIGEIAATVFGIAGLLRLAAKSPHGFFVLGGVMFVAAVALQFWATFYPVQ